MAGASTAVRVGANSHARIPAMPDPGLAPAPAAAGPAGPPPARAPRTTRTPAPTAPAASPPSTTGGGGGGRVAAGAQTIAGFALGFFLWGWVGIPLLKGGPTAVRNQLRAKFLNSAPDGSPLP